MKQLLLVFLLLLSFVNFSQDNDDFTNLIKTGISLHNNGDYEEAIEVYNKALELQPGSSLALYEISYAYLENKDYEKAIDYANQVLEIDGDNRFAAYLIKGSALDLTDRTDESNEVFLKGIEDVGPHHLLYYNLAVNYGKLLDHDQAISYATEALFLEPSHVNSHFILATSEHAKGNKTQTVLASSLFLYFEDGDGRAPFIYELLMENLEGNSTKSKDGSTIINLDVDKLDQDSFYTSMDLMLSIMDSDMDITVEDDREKKKKKGKKTNKKKKAKKAGDVVEEDTSDLVGETAIIESLLKNELNLFLSMLSERLVGDDAPSDIYAALHGPIFNEFKENDFLELVTHLIQFNFDQSSKDWVESNHEKLEEFVQFLETEE